MEINITVTRLLFKVRTLAAMSYKISRGHKVVYPHRNGGMVDRIIARAKDKNDLFRLMGFGHRVYKTYDPRAKIMKEMCDKILDKLKTHDPLLDLAKDLEAAALNDDYFVEKKIYPTSISIAALF